MNLNLIQIIDSIFKKKKSLDNKGLWICHFLCFTRPWWPSNVLGDNSYVRVDLSALRGFILRLLFISEYVASCGLASAL